MKTTLDEVDREGLSDEVICKLNLKKRRSQLCRVKGRACQAVRIASAKALTWCWRRKEPSMVRI